jgi:hypothetical protein
MKQYLLFLTRVFALGMIVLVFLRSDKSNGQMLDSAMPQTRLLSVSPAGAKIGTTVEVLFAGTDLEGLEKMIFSHSGIKAEPVFEEVKKEDPKKADPKKSDKAPAPPAAPKLIKFKVTVPADTPLGIHDVRISGKAGISNSRAFQVTDLNEISEKEPNNDIPEAQKIEINTVVNGVISAATDVDFFSIKGKKGQRILASCLASSLDSKCNPLVEIFDTENRLLSSSKNYDVNDALADFTVPIDGDYIVRVCQFTYNAGSAEHFYRLMVGTFPWIDAVFPNAVAPGQTVPVTYYGRNLPGGVLDPTQKTDGVVLEKVSAPLACPTTGALSYSKYTTKISPQMLWNKAFETRLKNASGSSNAVLATVSDVPVVLEKDDNDTIAKAQKIATPCLVSGRIDKRGDKDWYSFSAKKSEKVLIKLAGEALGSQADLFFRVVGKDGKSAVTELDDKQDPLNIKLGSNTTDPGSYLFNVPEDGDYSVLVGSRQSSNLFGARHHYQLRLAPPAEDFTLVVMPSSNFRPDVLTIPKGGMNYLSVFAFREDGFKGEIVVTAEGLPAGTKAEPLTINESLNRASLVILGEENAAETTSIPKITGTATVNGKKLTREAIPVAIVWPLVANQNIVAISRVDRGIVAEVRDKNFLTMKATIDKNKIVQGDKGTIKVVIVKRDPEMKAAILVEPVDLPANFVNNNKAISIAPAANDGTIPVTVPVTQTPGVYSIVLRGQTNLGFPKDAAGKQKAAVNVVSVITPLELTVLPKALGEFSVTNTGVQVKAGAEGKLELKVKRLHNYEGTYKVEVVIPANAKGIVLEPSEFAINSDATQIKVKVAADAMPGPRNDIVLKFKGMFLGKDEVIAELKANISVVK